MYAAYFKRNTGSIQYSDKIEIPMDLRIPKQFPRDSDSYLWPFACNLKQTPVPTAYSSVTAAVESYLL